MGVFKDLAIQAHNDLEDMMPKCSKCGGANQTASIACFNCLSTAPRDVTTGGYDWNALKLHDLVRCDYCGMRMTHEQATKCHEECTTVYCSEHIVKYGGGVK